MIAVIDTNVLISGLFWKGPPADVLAAWLVKKFEWIVSADILTEYHITVQSLEAKYPAPASALAFLRGISLSAKLTLAADLKEQVCTDSDDDKFISAALSGHASTIVSGDKALLQVDGYCGLRIVKPAVFLKLLYSARSKSELFWQYIFRRNKEGEKKERRRPFRPLSTFFESDDVVAKKVRQKAQIMTALSIT